jgi:hypothetical protein
MIKMRTYLIIILWFWEFSILLSQPEKKLSIGEQPVYKVSKVKEPIDVDGKMDESSWKKAETRTLNYYYRWDRVPVPDKQKTVFRMLWDDENLYLFYECKDSCLTAREKNPDSEPYYDDCAEFFCIPVPDSMNIHFAFELNLYKVAYDFVQFENFYNGNPSVIKSYNPAYKIGLTYEGTLNNDTDKDTGWKMELAIPFSAFSDTKSFFPVKAGTIWTFQAARQDRNILSDKSRTGSTIFPLSNITKNIHQSSRFGLMEFVE